MAARPSSVTRGEIINLSQERFKWKTEGKLDQLAEFFSDELVFIHITGNITSKKQWIDELRSGRFIYNTITVKTAEAKACGDTAVLAGRLGFIVPQYDTRATLPLIYTEVFTRKNGA